MEGRAKAALRDGVLAMIEAARKDRWESSTNGPACRLGLCWALSKTPGKGEGSCKGLKHLQSHPGVPGREMEMARGEGNKKGGAPFRRAAEGRRSLAAVMVHRSGPSTSRPRRNPGP